MIPTPNTFPQLENFNALQGQAPNLMFIQSMQDYLKYLILNVNTTEINRATLVENPMETTTSSPVRMLPMTPTPTNFATPVKKNKNQKTSARLWNLMASRYSTKKIKTNEPEADEKDCIEKGEVYRKYNGLYIPVLKNNAKPTKRENICGHADKEYYARGLCGACYSKVGRDKKPWNCEHDKLYALGLCHKCYTAKNRQMRKERKDRKLQKPKSISKIFRDLPSEEKEPVIEEEELITEIKQEDEIVMKQEF